MNTSKNKYVYAMFIIGGLFFIIGFVTWVNGTLIPYLKITCELKTDLQSYLVATAFFIAYTVMALPASVVLKKTGYKKGMILSLFIMAVGTATFIPAALTRTYGTFLTGLFIIGSGLALLQTAVNPYVSIIGPIESAAKRISFMGIANKVAGILAGLIFGYITLTNVDDLEAKLKLMDNVTKEATLHELSSRVIGPYIILTLVLIIIGIAIYFSGLPDIKDEKELIPEGGTKTTPDRKNIFQYPHLLLGVITLFLYVGVEVIAGDMIISYGNSLGIELSTARFLSQGTLAFMLIGYLIGIVTIPKYISQEKALRICATLGIIFSIGAILSSSYVSVGFIAALGLANSLMWPAIFPLAINGLGRFTKTGSAMLIMAVSGGAILPLIYGQLSLIFDSKTAYIMMIPCYLFILFFAMKGYKAGRDKKEQKRQQT